MNYIARISNSLPTRTLRVRSKLATSAKVSPHLLKITRPLSSSSKMSFFPKTYFTPEASFTPLFRLLDDYDSYSREVSAQHPGTKSGRRDAHLTFSPRFDVKELENNYELHGELPGVEKDNIRIEFTDSQTIVISGRTERTYTAGTPPSVLLEGSNSNNSGTITDGGDNSSNASHKATVADEEAEKAKEQQGTEVVKHKQRQQQAKEKFWVSERSVGEFSRTFSFPSPVNLDAVGANLKDGILTVTVPKARKPEGRRIAIN